MPKSAYLRDALLTFLKEDGFAPELLNGVSVSLHTDDPGEDGVNEYAGVGGNYTRANSTGFIDGDNPGELKNSADVLFNEVQPGDDYDDPITHFGLWDQGGGPGSGNYLGGNALDVPRTLVAGMTPRFAAGSLVWSEF